MKLALSASVAQAGPTVEAAELRLCGLQSLAVAREPYVVC